MALVIGIYKQYNSVLFADDFFTEIKGLGPSRYLSFQIPMFDKILVLATVFQFSVKRKVGFPLADCSLGTSSSPLHDGEGPVPVSLSPNPALSETLQQRKGAKIPVPVPHYYCNFVPCCCQQPKSPPKPSSF